MNPISKYILGALGVVTLSAGTHYALDSLKDREQQPVHFVEKVDYKSIDDRMREALRDYVRKDERSVAVRVPVPGVADNGNSATVEEMVAQAAKKIALDKTIIRKATYPAIEEATTLYIAGLGEKNKLGYDTVKTFLDEQEEQHGPLTQDDLTRIRKNFEGMGHYDTRLGLSTDARTGIMKNKNNYQVGFMKTHGLSPAKFNTLARDDPQLFRRYMRGEWDMFRTFVVGSDDDVITQKQKSDIINYMAQFAHHLQEGIDDDLKKAKKKKDKKR